MENGERVAREIGPSAIFRRLDVRREKEWQQLIDDVMARYGRLDVLVNNAGVAEFHTPETIKTEQYRFVMEVSVDGTVYGCKHAIPAMKASGGGSIINMASVASVTGEPYVAGYCAAKGAVEAYSRAVAVYSAQNQLNIRCNSFIQLASIRRWSSQFREKPRPQGLPIMWRRQRGLPSIPLATRTTSPTWSFIWHPTSRAFLAARDSLSTTLLPLPWVLCRE